VKEALIELGEINSLYSLLSIGTMALALRFQKEERSEPQENEFKRTYFQLQKILRDIREFDDSNKHKRLPYSYNGISYWAV